MIRFTNHAIHKFTSLAEEGIFLTKKQVIQVFNNPEYTIVSKGPVYISESAIDAKHLLRVVYKQEEEIITIITFYPGRRKQYEKRR